MARQVQKQLLSPAAMDELTQILDGNARSAAMVSYMLAKAQPVIILENGQAEKEKVLASWIRSKGGQAFITKRFISFDGPYLGRGGER